MCPKQHPDNATISRNSVSPTDTRKQKGLVHYHDKHELYYLLTGQSTYFIDTEIYHIEKGNFIFIPKGISHKTDYESNQYTKRILIWMDDHIFTPEMEPILQELTQNTVFCIPDSKLPLLEELLFQIESESALDSPHKELFIDLKIKELLLLICRFRQERKPRIREADQIIYTISEYIAANYPQDLSLKTLSKTFAISESHLSRKFKAVTGMGLQKYITYVRMNNAEKLIKEGNLPVPEIALQCGYHDPDYFAMLFKQMKGMTPFQMLRR